VKRERKKRQMIIVQPSYGEVAVFKETHHSLSVGCFCTLFLVCGVWVCWQNLQQTVRPGNELCLMRNMSCEYYRTASSTPFSDLISKPRVCVSPASDPTCVCCLAAAAFCKPCIEGMWQQFMMRMSLIDGVDVQYEGAHHLP
jgi:hypothetical protein